MAVSSILATKHRKRIGTSTTSISNSVPAKTTNYLDRNQPSMTQMVKLASVHSGHDEMRERFGGNAVSLTQLRLLPLRLQLKIANNHDLDEKNVSFLRKGTRGTVGPYSSQGGTGQDNRSIVSGNEQIQNKIEKRRSYTIPPPAPFAAVKVCNYEKMIENDSSDGNDVLSLLSGDPPDSISTYATDLHSADPTFLQNDLLPFVGYLDSTITSSSCHPTHDDISNVCQFLRICIKENRTCAVVALLHNMKQRNDAWGRRSSHAGNAIQENGSSDHFNLYTFVVGEVQEQYFLSEQRCLDIVGLGL